jgi:hypothetical protein
LTPVKSKFRKLIAKRAVKTLLFSFLLYCLITLAFHYFSFIHAHPSDFNGERFRELTVALWANVIFAGTFGVLAAVMSLFRPEEESLDKRLGYLYPRSSTLSGEARARLGKNAMKLAAPGVFGDLYFILERFDAEKNAFWLTVSISFRLRNILQDEVYEDEIEISVAPDVVSGVTELGRLLESSITCSEADPPRIVHVFSRPITVDAKRFQEFVKVKIPAGAEAIHSYSFSGWSVIGIPWQSNAQRYTENVQVRVDNRTGRQITCKLSKGTNNPTLAPDLLTTRALSDGEEATLKEGLVLNGYGENLQLLFDL